MLQGGALRLSNALGDDATYALSGTRDGRGLRLRAIAGGSSHATWRMRLKLLVNGKPIARATAHAKRGVAATTRLRFKRAGTFRARLIIEISTSDGDRVREQYVLTIR
jgi:hypothetical protein